jgi:FdhE protein
MKESTILDGIPEIVNVRPPVPERVFASRAARFHSLAPGSVLRDYLEAMGQLAHAQHEAVAEVHFVPEIKTLQGEYPIQAGEWRRDGSWRRALAAVLSKTDPASLPSPARAAMTRLSACSSEELESSADALLAGDYARLELASASFLGAALQVYWAALAGVIAVSSEARQGNACPLCASPAVAGVVLGDNKLRYLVCGLCSTEWYSPRLTCASCGSTEAISYFGIEGDASGAKAECCSRCSAYLKLFYLEATPAAEPFADDAATLALDTLISEEGFSRTGPNFYLLPGTGSGHCGL